MKKNPEEKAVLTLVANKFSDAMILRRVKISREINPDSCDGCI